MVKPRMIIRFSLVSKLQQKRQAVDRWPHQPRLLSICSRVFFSLFDEGRVISLYSCCPHWMCLLSRSLHSIHIPSNLEKSFCCSCLNMRTRASSAHFLVTAKWYVSPMSCLCSFHISYLWGNWAFFSRWRLSLAWKRQLFRYGRTSTTQKYFDPSLTLCMNHEYL